MPGSLDPATCLFLPDLDPVPVCSWLFWISDQDRLPACPLGLQHLGTFLDLTVKPGKWPTQIIIFCQMIVVTYLCFSCRVSVIGRCPAPHPAVSTSHSSTFVLFVYLINVLNFPTDCLSLNTGSICPPLMTQIPYICYSK